MDYLTLLAKPQIVATNSAPKTILPNTSAMNSIILSISTLPYIPLFQHNARIPQVKAYRSEISKFL